MTYYAPIHRISLVREGSLSFDNRPSMREPQEAVRVFRRYYEETMPGLDREVFTLATLSVKRKLIGMHVVSVGCLTTSLVHPRELFKTAILASAASIVCCHNHPSGDPEPSAEDVGLTRRLVQGGQLLGIGLLDHVVLGEGIAVSLKERGVV